MKFKETFIRRETLDCSFVSKNQRINAVEVEESSALFFLCRT